MTHAFDWNAGPLADGLRCYRNEKFFLAHEHWEAVWLTLDEPDKTFLQALIQTAAAFHHLGSHNPAGTLSLLRRALRRLEAYPPAYCGVSVEELRKGQRAWIGALERQERPQISYPRIK
jgi:predicted metal-dependent hydrolase